MMQQIPENLQSIPDPGGRFGLVWQAVEGVQSWHVVRCDYPISTQNGAGLLSGGLDLMVTRWDLHPTAVSVVEDTGIQGKHYLVLGMDAQNQLHVPPEFSVAGDVDGKALSELTAVQGWLKGVSKKDRYSGMF